MSDDCEYELNALCQKLTKVLTDHECLTKTRSVYKVLNIFSLSAIKLSKNLSPYCFYFKKPWAYNMNCCLEEV